MSFLFFLGMVLLISGMPWAAVAVFGLLALIAAGTHEDDYE